jgi:hypothetical protein
MTGWNILQDNGSRPSFRALPEPYVTDDVSRGPENHPIFENGRRFARTSNTNRTPVFQVTIRANDGVRVDNESNRVIEPKPRPDTRSGWQLNPKNPDHNDKVHEADRTTDQPRKRWRRRKPKQGHSDFGARVAVHREIGSDELERCHRPGSCQKWVGTFGFWTSPGRSLAFARELADRRTATKSEQPVRRLPWIGRKSRESGSGRPCNGVGVAKGCDVGRLAVRVAR